MILEVHELGACPNGVWAKPQRARAVRPSPISAAPPCFPRGSLEDFLAAHRTALSTVVYGRVFIKRGGKIPLCRGRRENTLMSGIAYTKQSKIIRATFPAAPGPPTAGKILQEGGESFEKVQQVTEGQFLPRYQQIFLSATCLRKERGQVLSH